MGRKKKAVASTNGSAASANAKPQRGERTAAIRELFASGVTEASGIRAALKERGLSVSDPVIYQTLNKLRGGVGSSSNGKKRGRRKGRAAAATTPAAVTPRTSSGSLGLEVIQQLAEITKKAGGVDVVVGLLQTMKKVQ